MEGLVKIADYLDANQAELARAELESAGIPAAVFVEDLALQGPRSGRLMVPATAVREACEVLELDQPEQPPPGWMEGNARLLFMVLLAIAVLGILRFVIRYL